MNRLTRLAVACTLLFGSIPARSAQLDDLAKQLTKNLPAQPPSKVAVLAFPYHDGRVSSGSSIVQERLTTLLAQSGAMQVIERHLVEKVLEEQSQSAGPDTLPSELRKKLGADAIVTGTLIDVGWSRTEINARFINTQDGRILSAGRERVWTQWKDEPRAPADQAWRYWTPDALGRRPTPVDPAPVVRTGKRPLVQLALLLDTSNSMDGLIQQAKTQLWKIVNEMAYAQQDGQAPIVQVALYEYGNDSLSAESGYVRRIVPFTANLDDISERLFALTTNGGSEYCGHVIQHATRHLDWDPRPGVYKAIFIAGNEPFTQGPTPFRESIAAAARKGINVNTIFCGQRMEGIQTAWLAGAQAGHGSFMTIDQNADIAVVATPYDAEIQRLGMQMNDTYIGYGSAGWAAKKKMAAQDAAAESYGKSGTLVERMFFKASPSQRSASGSWDLVSGLADNKVTAASIKVEALPAELQGKSRKEVAALAQEKLETRNKLQAKINALQAKRGDYLASKAPAAPSASTLDTVVKDTVRDQARSKGFVFTK